MAAFKIYFLFVMTFISAAVISCNACRHPAVFVAPPRAAPVVAPALDVEITDALVPAPEAGGKTSLEPAPEERCAQALVPAPVAVVAPPEVAPVDAPPAAAPDEEEVIPPGAVPADAGGDPMSYNGQKLPFGYMLHPRDPPAPPSGPSKRQNFFEALLTDIFGFRRDP